MARVSVAALVVACLAGCGASPRRTYTVPASWSAMISPPWAPTHAAYARQAARLAALSRSVSRITRGASSNGAFVWIGTTKRPRVVNLRFPLSHPTAIDAVVPYADIPPDAPSTGECTKPYYSGWERLRSQGVTALYVGVDVTTHRVVDVSTNRRQVLSPVHGRPYPQCDEIPSG